jgi:hypothetical protein
VATVKLLAGCAGQNSNGCLKKYSLGIVPLRGFSRNQNLPGYMGRSHLGQYNSSHVDEKGKLISEEYVASGVVGKVYWSEWSPRANPDATTDYNRSKIPAAPMPPPMHIVTMP